MPKVANETLRRSLTFIAAAIAVITVAAISLDYIWTAYEYERERIHGRANLAAMEMSKIVYTRPDTWMYQEQRLSELLESIVPDSVIDGRPQSMRIFDLHGALIAKVNGPISPPTITVRHPVTDGFTIVGTIELAESVGHIWLRAVPVFLVGLALAIAIFVTLKVLPLRALFRHEGALEAALQENRESEAQLRLVSDAMPVLIGYVDSDERVRVMNKIGEAWYARPRAEIIGRSFRELVPAFLTGQVNPHVKAALSGETVIFEHTVTYADGVPRRVRGHYSPHVAPDGRVQGFFALVEDVTEQRETETKLRQAQKTEAIGQLTGGIAHDFNNLLGIILGNVELLHDCLRNDPSALKLTGAALNACLRGGEMTQRLLAFSRTQTLMPRVIIVNELITNITTLLRRTIASSIQIDTVLADDLWPCSVDAGQLENAIVNLGINARDAMPDGGRLTIESANVEIDDDTEHSNVEGLAPGSFVSITITDSGTGMAPDVIARAFEPFFTTKDVGKGSGLGLSMVYGFAKQSGGQAKIYSELGVGTSVRIYLPRANAQDNVLAMDRPGMAEVPASRGEIILVVEDAEALRQVAVTHLQSLGYTVLQAGESRTALALLKERPDIDLLFTDVVLRDGIKGGELARQAKARHPNLKVLFTSGYARNALSHQGRLDKGVRLLEKPYRKQDLARCVREALDEVADERATA
jgi:PAS domain S-box-containing protein